MKILHTSDWHLGHEHYNYRRQDEFEDFFCQLRRIVEDEKPDALLVSGDVYHSSVPAISTQTMYTEAMLDLHLACPQMTIVVTAGNHDSASRLEVDRSLWGHFKVHVVGTLARTPEGVDLDRHIIPIADKGWVVAVPHVFKQNFPPAPDGGTDRQTAFFKVLLDRVAQLNTQQKPVVLMAHLAVAEKEGNTTPYDVGGMEFDDISTLGTGFDYAALGHIHQPRTVTSDSRARYCGAPLPITFREEYEHSVTMAEIDHEKPPKLRIIPIHPLRHVRTIPKEPVDFDKAIDILKEHDPDDTAYIQLHVKSANGLPPDCNERAINAAKGKKCRFCTFLLVDERDSAARRQLIDVTPDEFKAMTPVEVARRYLEGKGLPPEEYIEMLQFAIETINEEKAR
ncbi:MAG: exonuclease SbcCD subunit D [Prevotella sp.]|nr:exonuclease SbcCD subunit D [Prevotella sp.]